MNCKICAAESHPAFQAVLLHKYTVQYYQCPKCGFLQTEPPTWLAEAYQSPINFNDTGLITRNLLLSLKSALIIQFLFDRRAKFIDYAGGWGILTRLMRDIGFDYYWFDEYTKNEAARGFDADLTARYEMATVFEAFEHFEQPNAEIDKLFRLTDSILFSTTLLPEPMPQPGGWWYYGFEHGQHIAFYTRGTFQKIAEQFSCRYITDGKYLHLLTKKPVSRAGFKFLCSTAGFILLPVVFLLNKSKTRTDHKRLSAGM
jgi:hypothetical protein